VVRSLSCELCPGREGPMIFSESEGRLHALSYMFKVHDFEARGYYRWYSLILVLQDSTKLFSAYDLVTAKFRQIVERIQRAADINYEDDSKTGNNLQPRQQPTRRAFSMAQSGRPLRSSVALRSLPQLLQIDVSTK
jgi:folliculin